MGVPFIDLTRFENGFLEEVTAKATANLKTCRFIGGPDVTELEKELTQWTESQSTVACANGTDALQLMLRAGGIGPGDVVLLPDMTFWATFEAIVNVGARPVTLDVDPRTLHLSASALEEAIERFRPRALILVHLYGWAAPDTQAIRRLCAARDVRCFEDCAQAFGTRLDGQSLIGSAWFASTSFYPAKVFGASGDAGAVFTSSTDLAATTKRLTDHGRTSHYSHGYVGWNSRIGAYEAGYLRSALKRLPARLASRRQVCRWYREELQGLPLEFLSPAEGVEENGYCTVAMMEPEVRQKLIEKLKAAEIGHNVIYPGAMSRQEGARDWLAGSIDHGQADRIARSVLSLPCFAYMTEKEFDEVARVVRGVFT